MNTFPDRNYFRKLALLWVLPATFPRPLTFAPGPRRAGHRHPLRAPSDTVISGSCPDGEQNGGNL